MRIASLLLSLLILIPAASAEERKPNRLASERSPYLRQHQFNPVDWYPWGPEALAKAKRENRPIFLSIGYAACHWCHVMEHESFEHPNTGRILSRAFVCIKVDREERPDLDEIYMASVYAMGERGGWPTTLVLTPEGKPFWGGTYLRRARLESLAADLSRRWKRDPTPLRARAEKIARTVARTSAGPNGKPFRGTDDALLTYCRSVIARNHDARNGGGRASRKFPPHAELFLMLDRLTNFADAGDLKRVRRTLNAMDEGGFHDHVGGGFHRYTVDEVWFLPHFEKMLYDNAWLLRAYSAMYAKTGDERDRRTALRCLAWIERELKQGDKGFASSLDADTDGHEGLTYTWTVPELNKTLDPRERRWVPAVLGAKASGNFEGRNIPYLPKSLASWAQQWNQPVADVRRRLDVAMERLRVVRDQRAQPRLDDKIITSWNGMLLGALARAGADLKHPPALLTAQHLAMQILVFSADPDDGGLLRFPFKSGAKIPAFCEDYVHLIDGLLELADVTGQDQWNQSAEHLGEELVERFEDKEQGGFWASSADQHEALFARAKDGDDNPIPSDNGMAARVCLRLFMRTGNEKFRDAAYRTLTRFRPSMSNPSLVSSISLVHALALRQVFERTIRTAGTAVESRQDMVRVWAQISKGQSGTHKLSVRVMLDHGWHVQSNEPTDPNAYATSLTSDTGTLVVTYPIGSGPPYVGNSGPARQYRETFDITAQLTNATPTTRIHLTLQPCDSEGICKAPMDLVLDVPLPK